MCVPGQLIPPQEPLVCEPESPNKAQWELSLMRGIFPNKNEWIETMKFTVQTNGFPVCVSLQDLERVFVMTGPQMTGQDQEPQSVQLAHLWVLHPVSKMMGPPPQSSGSRTAPSLSRLHCLCLVMFPPPQETEHWVQGSFSQAVCHFWAATFSHKKVIY